MDVSAICSNFAMAEYPAYTSISIPTIRERMKHGLDGVRIVSGDILSFLFTMRPLSTVRFKFDLHDLEQKALDAIRDVLRQQMPLLDENGNKHLVRITPYGTSEKRRGAHHARGRSQIAAFPSSEIAVHLMFDNSFLRYCSHCFH